MRKLKPKKFKKALRLRLDGLTLAVQSFAVRLFEIEPGGYSPHHSHSWEHEIFVLEGNGVVIGNNGVEAFSVGNVISIPS